jgi:DNA-binding transcriptional MerR regulator
MGLLWSKHPDSKSQRYYDADALERLKQIVILRKLQIPVKDLVVIFKNESMTTLIQAFVDKLESLDTEISALSELRHLVDDFLHKMQSLFEKYGFTPNPGLRNCFYRKEPNGEWMMLIKIPNDYENTTEFADENFTGGLFAVASSFMEDMDDTFILLKEWVNNSDYYEHDVTAEVKLPRHEMIEEILPWDIANKLNRYQQDLFIPIQMKNTPMS